MVPRSDAVIRPWAVVVEAGYAVVANGAVLGSDGFGCPTSQTECAPVQRILLG